MSNVSSSFTELTSRKIPKFDHAIVIVVVLIITAITLISFVISARFAASTRRRRRRQPEHEVETGLDDATLNSWPKLTYAEAKLLDPRAAAADCCSVCLDEFDEEDGNKLLRLLPDCGHLFHEICVDPWLRRQPTCPVCRSSAMNGAMSTALAELTPVEP